MGGHGWVTNPQTDHNYVIDFAVGWSLRTALGILAEYRDANKWWHRMTRDDKWWPGMKGDNKGWQVMTSDKRWQVMTSDDKWWQAMTSDDRRWQVMTRDDEWWQSVTNDDRRWQVKASDDKGWQVINDDKWRQGMTKAEKWWQAMARDDKWLRVMTIRHVMTRYDKWWKGMTGRKQANVSVRMAWISFGALPCSERNLMTARLSMLLKSRASRTRFWARRLPGRAKDLSAPRYLPRTAFNTRSMKENYFSVGHVISLMCCVQVAMFQITSYVLYVFSLRYVPRVQFGVSTAANQ